MTRKQIAKRASVADNFAATALDVLVELGEADAQGGGRKGRTQQAKLYFGVPRRTPSRWSRRRSRTTAAPAAVISARDRNFDRHRSGRYDVPEHPKHPDGGGASIRTAPAWAKDARLPTWSDPEHAAAVRAAFRKAPTPCTERAGREEGGRRPTDRGPAWNSRRSLRPRKTTTPQICPTTPSGQRPPQKRVFHLLPCLGADQERKRIHTPHPPKLPNHPTGIPALVPWNQRQLCNL